MKMEFVITKNEELQGIEVDFLEKPEPEVTIRLKTSGLRWNPKTKVWYCRLSHGFTPEQVKSIVLGDDSHSITQLMLSAFQASLSAYKEEHQKLRGIKPRHAVVNGNGRTVGLLKDLCGFSWVKFWATTPQNKRFLKHLKTISDTEDTNSWIYRFDETISLRMNKAYKGGFELRIHFTGSNLNPEYITPQKASHQAFCSVMNQKAYDLYEDSRLG
jgi:hypothetical protein